MPVFSNVCVVNTLQSRKFLSIMKRHECKSTLTKNSWSCTSWYFMLLIIYFITAIQQIHKPEDIQLSTTHWRQWTKFCTRWSVDYCSSINLQQFTPRQRKKTWSGLQSPMRLWKQLATCLHGIMRVVVRPINHRNLTTGRQQFVLLWKRWTIFAFGESQVTC